MARKVNANLFASTTGDQEPERSTDQAQSPSGQMTPAPTPDPSAARSTVSFYFTEAASKALESAWSGLRSQAAAHGVKVSAVSKSAIVDLAVQWACADYEARGDDSALATLLKSK